MKINNLNEHTIRVKEDLKAGKITESQYYELRKEATNSVYLNHKEPYAQCGHTGNEQTWVYSRIMPLLEVLNKNGSFIDVACANGYINESLFKWTNNSPIDIEYYGVDISKELIDIAKQRMPQFADNYYVANVDGFIPPKKFDYVRILAISFIPEYKHKNFVDSLFNDYLKNTGRLILGPYTEAKNTNEFMDYIEYLGYKHSGYLTKSYGGKERKMFWIDKNI